MKCNSCDQEMLDGVGCTLIKYEGEDEERIPYPLENNHKCHDCNTPPGGLHHPGCDMERCVYCGGQAITCGCGDE